MDPTFPGVQSKSFLDSLDCCTPQIECFLLLFYFFNVGFSHVATWYLWRGLASEYHVPGCSACAVCILVGVPFLPSQLWTTHP